MYLDPSETKRNHLYISNVNGPFFYMSVYTHVYMYIFIYYTSKFFTQRQTQVIKSKEWF